MNHTTMIPKKKDSNDINDKRTIRVPDPFLNCLEFCINEVFNEKVIPQWDLSQFGGRKKKSTYHAILSFINTINYNIINKFPIYGLIADVRKAFDSMNNNFIIMNLYNNYKISGKLIRILNNIMNNNFIKVNNEGLYTGIIKINSGVPQGGVGSINMFNTVLMYE